MRPVAMLLIIVELPISIHASLTGCDQFVDYAAKEHFISIHASLTGCDR